MKRLIGHFNVKEAFDICDYENKLLIKPYIGSYDREIKLEGENLTIIDFGGSFGNLFYSVVNKESIKEWVVVETPIKVNAATQTDKLKFTTKIPESADIVFCNGVLQYLPNWRKTLIELLQTGASLFVFRRMSFGREVTRIQKSWLSENGDNGGIKDRLIFYPHTTIPKREFLQYLKGVRYIIQ